jgi:hypothetical protein
VRRWEAIHAALDRVGVIGFPIDEPALVERWLQVFFANVKRATGEWVHLGFCWHGYSYGFETALDGDDARAAYIGCGDVDLVAYFEHAALLFDCGGARAPRLETLDTDVYVFPRTLGWSMAFTHERSLGLGPYFACAATRTSLG